MDLTLIFSYMMYYKKRKIPDKMIQLTSLSEQDEKKNVWKVTAALVYVLNEAFESKVQFLLYQVVKCT